MSFTVRVSPKIQPISSGVLLILKVNISFILFYVKFIIPRLKAKLSLEGCGFIKNYVYI